ncbi:MAG: ATP-binding protein [Sphingomonadales bacterium]|jgi:hypothetical protein|nr:ATP-binding protein [Sphingomonadales bacterium]MBK9269940.1 ATP-binding protein [Sphingomonadales bacterium]
MIIRTQVAPEAIDKVTRLFNGSLTDIANELLQNARRAAASTIDITVGQPDDTGTTLTISDDGTGIPDPQTLLALGRSDWPSETCRREDPAGMGFFSLAGLTTRVETASFSMTIPHDAWTGNKDIEIEPGTRQAGTAITFKSTITSAEAITKRLQEALLFYPLRATIDGEPVKQADFLLSADNIVTIGGLRIGVFKTELSPNHANINFYGLTLNHKLPAISEIEHSRWSVKVDIIDDPDLVLVLPARKELFQNEAAQRLARNCLEAIYRTIAAEPFHRLAFDKWQEACTFTDLPPAKPILSPWRPAPAHQDYRERYAPEPIPKGAILYDAGEPSDDISLARALDFSDASLKLFTSIPAFSGYDWYDAIPAYATDAYRCLDDNGSELESDAITQRPHRLTITLASPTAPPIELDTDAAILACDAYCPDDVAIAVTNGSTIDADDLATMIYDAVFSPSDDADADSWDSQSSRFQHDAQVRAVEILNGSSAAVMADIRLAFFDKIAWRIPRGKKLTLSYANGNTELALADLEETAP